MKNISLAFNAILARAVMFLYYLHFSGSSKAQQTDLASGGNLRLAYINSDSVLKYYDYFKASREKLEAKGMQLDKDLKARATGLQGEFDSYQRSVNSLTIGQARAVEEDLTKKRQNLQLYQESLSQQMAVDQERMTKELYDKVTSFLRKYGEDNNLQIVFKYDATSDVLFASDSMDISTTVVKGLNEAYRLEKSMPAATDSVTKKK